MPDWSSDTRSTSTVTQSRHKRRSRKSLSVHGKRGFLPLACAQLSYGM
jgi:hypothetical protein